MKFLDYNWFDIELDPLPGFHLVRVYENGSSLYETFCENTEYQDDCYLGITWKL